MIVLPVIRNGRAIVITAPQYRQAKESAELSIKRQWKGREMLNGPVSLTARCFFPDRRRRDASNLSKMTCDALSGIVMGDDSQIVRETWEVVGLDKENPRVEIEITLQEPSNGRD